MANEVKETAIRFRKKPVVIEAVQFEGTTFDQARTVVEWADQYAPHKVVISHSNPRLNRAYELTIYTLEGAMRAEPGDWIIKGMAGELYPCKPDIFAATYEPENGSYLQQEENHVDPPSNRTQG